MDYKTLNNWRGIEKEIRLLEDLINTKTAAVIAFDNVHRDGSDVAGKRERLISEIEKHLEALRKATAIRNDIEDFVQSVTDANIRVAMRLHFLSGYTWLQIGMRLGFDESAIRRKVKAYASD